MSTETQKLKLASLAGIVFSVEGAFAVGMVGAWAFISTFFPGMSPGAIAIILGVGLSSSASEYMVFERAARVSLGIFAKGGIAYALQSNLMAREMLQDSAVIAQLREDYPRANEKDYKRLLKAKIRAWLKDKSTDGLQDYKPHFLKTQTNLKKEYGLKKWLARAALFISACIALGFGNLTFVAAGLFIPLPVLPFVLAVVAGGCFGLLFFHMFWQAIKTNYIKEFASFLQHVFLTEKTWSTLSAAEQIQHCIRAAIMTAAILTVFALAIAMSVFVGSTWIAASTATFNILFPLTAAAVLAKILIICFNCLPKHMETTQT